MAKVKGYYNTTNGIFLGPMVAINEATKVMSTPRYVEGVCFGEYDTETDKFVPMSNPVIIPRGQTFTQDDDFDDKGNIITRVSGIEEDKGADIKRRGSVAGYRFTSSRMETRDSNGRRIQLASEAPIEVNRVPQKKLPPKPKNSKIKEARPQKMRKADLPVINWDKLF